jgi:hypothetical protein
VIQAMCVAMVALTAATCPANSFGSPTTIAGENFVGVLTYANPTFVNGLPSPSNQITIGPPADAVSGQFTYNSGQPGTGTAAQWTYNFTLSPSVAAGTTAFSFQISNPPGTTALYTDSFFKNAVPNNDLYKILVTFNSTTSGGTTMEFETATLKVTNAQPAITLTFADPTNHYYYGPSDSLIGTYGVANSTYAANVLPLPDQATLSGFYVVSKVTPGKFVYGDEQFLGGDITMFYPLGGSIPEPSALLMGLMAIGIGTAGFCVSRRKQLRPISG